MCSKFTRGDQYRSAISKELRSTSAWVLCYKFAVDLQNTFSEEHLWGAASMFCIIYFGANNK